MARRKHKVKRSGECESCGFKTKLRRYIDGYNEAGFINPRFLCPLCAHTHFGHADLASIKKHLNYCTNAILAKLDEVQFHLKYPLSVKIEPLRGSADGS